jgi:hypothetical protein
VPSFPISSDACSTGCRRAATACSGGGQRGLQPGRS